MHYNTRYETNCDYHRPMEISINFQVLKFLELNFLFYFLFSCLTFVLFLMYSYGLNSGLFG